MEYWQNLYTELAQIITQKVPKIRWVDLWHNQVNFLDEEREFPTPAVFIALRTRGVDDLGEKLQRLDLQLDCYLFYETFSDTFIGSYNQSSALEFIGLIDGIKGALHGISGENFNAMRHIGFSPEDTGNAGNLYRVTFSCLVHDESAVKYYEDSNFGGLQINDQDYQLP